MLWGHDQKSLPIGRVTDIGPDGNALKATVQFVPGDINPQAETTMKMCQQGYLSATSVGFVPTDYALSDRMSKSGKPGLDIFKATLYELSIVAIPANSDALIEPRSLFDELLQQKIRIAVNIKARRLHRMLSITQ